MISFQYDALFQESITSLSEAFPHLPWHFIFVNGEYISQWLGASDEALQVVCFKGHHYIEDYHRQDFFFINFVIKEGYDVLSQKYDHHLHLCEGDCYIGQPFSGYALQIDHEQEVMMIGLHIKKDLFYQHYLSLLSRDTALFHFFLDPYMNQYAQEYIHLHFPDDHPLWLILETLVITYARKDRYTQEVLQSMMQTLILYISQAYYAHQSLPNMSLYKQMEDYIEQHSTSVSLKDLAHHFGYHPNYVSSLLKKEGPGFSHLLLTKRMEKARLLLLNTDLTLETIAAMIGYSNTSHFYKAFRTYFHCTPKQYLIQTK